MNRITFDKNKKMYRVYYKNKTFSYSINRYGKFAIKLAKKSLKTGIKYFDYYRIYNDIVVFFIYTKAYGVKKLFLIKMMLILLINLKFLFLKITMQKHFMHLIKNLKFID